MIKPTLQRGIDINLEPLKKVCQQYIDFIESEKMK